MRPQGLSCQPERNFEEALQEPNDNDQRRFHIINRKRRVRFRRLRHRRHVDLHRVLQVERVQRTRMRPLRLRKPSHLTVGMRGLHKVECHVEQEMRDL